MADESDNTENIELNPTHLTDQLVKDKAKEEERAKFYETKIAELELKIKEISKEKNLNEAAVYSLIEQKEQLNEQLSSVIMEISAKTKELNDLERTMNMDESNVNLLSSERDNLIKNAASLEEENIDEDRMIYKQLEYVLTEVADNLFKYQVPPYKKSHHIEYEKLLCKSVLVIFSDEHDNNSTFQFQTFTISKHSIFSDLKNVSCEFWEVNPKEYDLKFCDSNYTILNIPDMHLNIDMYLKNQDNCVKATTILLPKNKELDRAELKHIVTQKQSQVEAKKTKNSINIDDSVQEFFRKFVGLYTYMMKKLESLLKILMTLEDDSKLDEKKAEKSNSVVLFKVLMFVFYILFFVFVLQSLLMISPAKMYYMNSSITRFLEKQKAILYNRKSSILDDIGLKLSNFFLNDEGNRSGFLHSVLMVTSVRINFYRTNTKPCATFLVGKETCNQFAWDDSTKNITRIDFIENNKVQVPPGIYVLKDPKYNDNSELPIKDYSKIENYILDSINNLTTNFNNDTAVYEIKGFMSTYRGNTYTLFVNLFELNFPTFYTLLLNLKQTYLFDKGLRCIIVTFTFMHVQTNKFIYVYLLYEINTDGYIMDVNFLNKIISMNVYFGEEGKTLYVYDILRIIFNSIIFLSSIFYWYLEKGKLEKKNLKDLGNILAIFFQPTILANYIIAGMNILSFIIKFKYLQYDYTNINDIFIRKNINEKLQKDLFDVYFWYQILNYFETGLIFVLIARITMFFWEIETIRVFILYIKNSSYKLAYYIFFVYFILSGFSILSNNLWGVVKDELVDIAGSLANVLMSSIGHMEIIENSYQGWNTVYLFLFFAFFIYFLVNTFIGLYLEVYRMTTIMKGHLAEREKDMFSILKLNQLGGLTKNLLNNLGKGINKLGKAESNKPK